MTPSRVSPPFVLVSLWVAALCGVPSPGSAADDDAARGRALFERHCALCHAAGATPGGAVGPDLGGVVGRAAASVPGYTYTRALKASQLRWDAATLSSFLAAPTRQVPGTAMTVAVPDAAQREALIAFLATTRAPGAAPDDSAAPARERSGDWREDAPGKTHRVDLGALPAPYATPSSRHRANIAARPDGVLPAVPDGFAVSAWAEDLAAPRRIRVAANGDVFVAETDAGRVRVLRAADGAARAETSAVYVEGLDGPFGLAFYPPGGEPQWLYVATHNAVVRYAYRSGELAARGRPETIVDRLSDSSGGHSTRDLEFSADGSRLFVSIGSASNVAEGEAALRGAALLDWERVHGLGAAWGREAGRATVRVTDALGRSGLRPYANGLRNCVGLALQPATGLPWCAVNERDGLGDDLVPDYVTSVREGAFYGWPWYYLGAHEDPRHAGVRPDLKDQVTVPDVPLQAHSAALGLVFYEATSGVARFPAAFRGDAFVALHGSWNRRLRTGYKLVRVPIRDGRPAGGYEDFMTGFVTADDGVWGRPVGVAVARDGALLVSDDAGGRIWRIAPQR